MEVKVLELKLIDSSRPLKGFATVQVGDWVIRDFRIIKQNGQKAFISPPQISWKDPETGEIKYKIVLTIPSEQKQRIELEILSAFQKEMEKENGYR